MRQGKCVMFSDGNMMWNFVLMNQTLDKIISGILC